MKASKKGTHTMTKPKDYVGNELEAGDKVCMIGNDMKWLVKDKTSINAASLTTNGIPSNLIATPESNPWTTIYLESEDKTQQMELNDFLIKWLKITCTI